MSNKIAGTIVPFARGALFALVFIGLDVTLRLASSSNENAVDMEINSARLEQMETSAGLSERQFDEALGWIEQLRTQRTAKEEKKKSQQPTRASQENKPSEPKKTEAELLADRKLDPRFQVRGDKAIISLRGIFFDGEYFAVVETEAGSGSIESFKVSPGDTLEGVRFTAIGESQVKVESIKDNSMFVLTLFNQE